MDTETIRARLIMGPNESVVTIDPPHNTALEKLPLKRRRK